MSVLQIIFTLSAEKPDTFEECEEFSNSSVYMYGSVNNSARICQRNSSFHFIRL